VLAVRGVEVGGHRVLRAEATAVPNGIAAFLFHVRDATGRRPGVYFDWGEGNPVLHLIRYVLTGHGDVPPLTREIIRRSEPDPARRPAVYVGIRRRLEVVTGGPCTSLFGERCRPVTGGGQARPAWFGNVPPGTRGMSDRSYPASRGRRPRPRYVGCVRRWRWIGITISAGGRLKNRF